jgi:hypothetical protein
MLGVIATAVLVINGCKRFEAGECVQNVRDGYVWRIISDSWIDGYSAQGWVNGKWGVPLKGNLPISRNDHVKVPCPFSQKMIEEVP